MADDPSSHPAYCEVLGFDSEDVEKVIENLRSIRSLTPVLSTGEADRAKDREAMEKKEAEKKDRQSAQKNEPANK